MQRSENNTQVKRIAIFASGRGSNAKAILDYFQHDNRVEVVLIVSNNSDAGVLQLAKDYQIETQILTKRSFAESDELDKHLIQLKTDLLILAGFLWLVPARLVQLFPGKIINIHPALLPKYGGKGMFGMHVHEAVKNAGEKESGITIHSIDENYDEGSIILQKTIPLDPSYKASDIAENVLKLEHYFYPRVIEQLLFGQNI